MMHRSRTVIIVTAGKHQALFQWLASILGIFVNMSPLLSNFKGPSSLRYQPGQFSCYGPELHGQRILLKLAELQLTSPFWVGEIGRLGSRIAWPRYSNSSLDLSPDHFSLHVGSGPSSDRQTKKVSCPS